ncbi:MAG TPA: TIR domain-containing protein [Rhizomicrobium sp.]|nr:TIR domain-containing protein [Rhizomicrobium sp.]
MAGEIFISYRRADEAWARLLHRQLKAEGVQAWYDALIGPGQEWRLATAKALENSKIFVLLFSENAAQSSDIAKELAAATHEKKLVVPVRLQNIEPKGSFLYELASRNWVNAYEDTEVKLSDLAKGLAQLVRTGARDESVLPYERGPSRPRPRKSMRKPAIMAAAAIVMAAALAALFWIYPRPAALVANSQPPPKPSGVSVAVLPFLNLSSDKDQEFFSDGITEEITSALAKVPGLAVIGRTSAFQFKGENKDMRAIGDALGAKNLIEGSVRKAGDQVRITVQLIKAADGTHLWTESYDRKLTDIFAVQEDIATAIAGALQVPLGLKPGQNLVSNRTDTDSYQAYLRAKELVRARGFTNLTQATTLLEQVVARDPDYVPAWALLADAYALIPTYSSTVYATGEDRDRARDISFPKAEAAAHKAIALDANSAEAWTALASVLSQRGNLIQAEDSYKRALLLDPKNVLTLHFYAHDLSGVGRLKEALEIRQKLVILDPLDSRMKANLAHVLAMNGQFDSAIAMTKKTPTAFVGPASVYAAAGRFKEAADALLKVPPRYYPTGTVETAMRLLRVAPTRVASPQDIPAFPADLNFIYLYVGAASRALEYSEAEVKNGYVSTNVTDDFWYPAAAPLRNTERFKTLMRKVGFVKYWRARGWPDLCHPVGADDFACN